MPVNSELHSIAECEKTYKMVTGGATIPTECKNVDLESANAIARCVFLANGMPNFTDKSDGLWDRIVLIPFEHRFRDTEGEKVNLKQDLEKELPGILNWAIEGGKDSTRAPYREQEIGKRFVQIVHSHFQVAALPFCKQKKIYEWQDRLGISRGRGKM